MEQAPVQQQSVFHKMKKNADLKKAIQNESWDGVQARAEHFN
jgi:hypothetical protein